MLEVDDLAFDRRAAIILLGFVAAAAKIVGEAIQPPLPSIATADDRGLDQEFFPSPWRAAPWIADGWNTSAGWHGRRGEQCHLNSSHERAKCRWPARWY
jgi:hypothetical protein